MKPFLITESAKKLTAAYPPAPIIRETLAELSIEEKLGLLRLWVSEGIPVAFSGVPMLYEAIRGWLARELTIHAKAITTIGSARIGYSLAPHPEFGRAFRSTSDLDLTVVEDRL